MSPQEILVVDDEWDEAAILVYLLEAEGHRVQYARNGLVALDVLSRAAVDLVVTDFMMPMMDGCELLRMMRKSEDLAGTPALMLSEVREEVVREKCEAVTAFLRKPFTADKLLHSVRKILDRPGRSIAITNPMSPEAQAARVKKAQHNLAMAATEKIPATERSATDLADALASTQGEPEARAHITETFVTATESSLETRLEGLDDARLRLKDSPVDLYTGPTSESPETDFRTNGDLRDMLAGANARIVALETENRRLLAALEHVTGRPPDDNPHA